jgi:hypothetical protein
MVAPMATPRQYKPPPPPQYTHTGRTRITSALAQMSLRAKNTPYIYAKAFIFETPTETWLSTTLCVVAPLNSETTRRFGRRGRSVSEVRGPSYSSVTGFSPLWPGFDLRSSHVEFVALRLVSFKYFGFPCQFSVRRLLHTHRLSIRAGKIGPTVADSTKWTQCHPTPQGKQDRSETIASEHQIEHMYVCFLLSLLSHPENGIHMFLRNVGLLAFCSGDVMWFLWGTNWISFSFCSGDVTWFLWGTNWISFSFCSDDVTWFLWGTNWLSFSFCSGDVMWFLWGTNWVSFSFCSDDVTWFLWGTNWISFSFCSGDVMWFLWGVNWISLSFCSIKTCIIVILLRASVLVKSGLENRDYDRRGSAALTTQHPYIRKSWH